MNKLNSNSILEIISLIKNNFDSSLQKTNRKINEKLLKEKIIKAIKKDFCLIKKYDGKIIAFGWAQKNTDFFGNKFGEIMLIVVDKKFQKKGIGKKMLVKLEKKLKEKDLRVCCLTINNAKNYIKNLIIKNL